MFKNQKTKQLNRAIKGWKVWLFCILAIATNLSCTDDLANDGAPLTGPSFGITIVPQNPQVIKAGTVTFTATGGVTPYTYSLSGGYIDIGTIAPDTGVFTGVQALAAAPAGTATVTVVDSTGVVGKSSVTVVPTNIVLTPGSGIITEAAGTLEITAAVLTGSNLVTCSISRDDSSGTTAIPTVVVTNAICTATASAVPASGTETFTITITDSINGDYANAQLTIGTP